MCCGHTGSALAAAFAAALAAAVGAASAITTAHAATTDAALHAAFLASVVTSLLATLLAALAAAISVADPPRARIGLAGWPLQQQHAAHGLPCEQDRRAVRRGRRRPRRKGAGLRRRIERLVEVEYMQRACGD